MSSDNPDIITLSELFQACTDLEAAIRRGDVETAQKLVQLLALHNTRVNVTLEEITTPERKVWVRVMFENVDRQTIDLHVDSQISIRNIKDMVCKKFDFPPERQRCIIEERVRQDHETLASCNMTSDACVVHMHILPPAGLNGMGSTVEDSNLQRQILSNADGSKRLCLVNASVPSGSTSHQVYNAALEFPSVPPAEASGMALRLDYGTEDLPSYRHKSPRKAAATVTAEAGPSSSASEAPGKAEPRREPEVVALGSRQDAPIDQLNGISAANAVSITTTATEIESSQAVENTRRKAVENTGAREDENGNNTEDNSQQKGMWSCSTCTYLNHPDLLECEVCGFKRPCGTLEIPIEILAEAQVDSEEMRLKNYDDHLLINQFSIVTNLEKFNCAICMEDCEIGCGVVLRECLHMFCRSCLEDLVQHSEDPIVACPFNNGEYKCQSTLLECEIRALVNDELYQKHLQRSLVQAESQARNSYHCATPNCNGWCIYEDEVNTFYCAVCQHWNCLTCRAIHERMDCIQYQRKMKAKFHTDYDAKMAQASLEELFRMGEALKCPTCGIVIMKKEGCDWLMCTMCKTEICWVTRQARWGPRGHGDTSGGCQCRVNGRLCHPTCQNCH